MHRRSFLGATMLAQTAQIVLPPADEKVASGVGEVSYNVKTTVERKRTGKPHKGKMLAAIQPHCDDIPIFAGGAVLKLIDEGYEGILITVSDDSMAGEGSGYGEVVLKNEKDTREVARRLGLKEAIFLNYPNHNLDAWPIIEMRARLVFLFRQFKVDTIVVYDPSGLYERNPDHSVTAKAVEWAAAICGMSWDYPEFGYAGVKPHAVRERYYFSRGPQLVNRVVEGFDVMPPQGGNEDRVAGPELRAAGNGEGILEFREPFEVRLSDRSTAPRVRRRSCRGVSCATPPPRNARRYRHE